MSPEALRFQTTDRMDLIASAGGEVETLDVGCFGWFQRTVQRTRGPPFVFQAKWSKPTATLQTSTQLLSDRRGFGRNEKESALRPDEHHHFRWPLQ